MKTFQGKRVFLTGGSSGIGKATARMLVQHGAKVVIAARNAEKLEAAASEILADADNGSVTTLAVDVTRRAEVRQAADQVIDQLGGVDLLINNAGIARPGHFQDLPDEIFEAMMQVNYFGTVNVTRAFLPAMRSQRSGHICNVSSLAGVQGIFGYTAYAASKFAVVGFSDCLRQELLPLGIQVSLLLPPDTDTPQLQEENQSKPEQTRAIAGVARVLSAEEVATSLLRGIQSGRYRIVPGMAAQATEFLIRHAPAMVRWSIDRKLNQTRSA